MSKKLQDFLLGRSVSEFDIYPENHPDVYGVTEEEWNTLQAAGSNGAPVGFGDVRYVASSRHPWESDTGLCGSCEHRRRWESRESTATPRAECAWPESNKSVCYCWRLRKDLEPGEQP